MNDVGISILATCVENGKITLNFYSSCEDTLPFITYTVEQHTCILVEETNNLTGEKISAYMYASWENVCTNHDGKCVFLKYVKSFPTSPYFLN